MSMQNFGGVKEVHFGIVQVVNGFKQQQCQVDQGTQVHPLKRRNDRREEKPEVNQSPSSCCRQAQGLDPPLKVREIQAMYVTQWNSAQTALNGKRR